MLNLMMNKYRRACHSTNYNFFFTSGIVTPDLIQVPAFESKLIISFHPLKKPFLGKKKHIILYYVQIIRLFATKVI